MTDTLMGKAWESRNELYKELLGPYLRVSPENYLPPADSRLLRGSSAGDTGDPANNERALALLTYGPLPDRHHWTLTTAGLSNPWFQDEPQEVSGFGCELMLKTPYEAPWARRILRSMAFHVFNSTGTLSPGRLVRLNAPITSPEPSQLNSFFVWYADEAPDAWYQLPSGGFGLFVVVGITEDECHFAELVGEYGTWCIQELLRQAGIGQVTDCQRKSIMDRPEIVRAKQSVVDYARNFAGLQSAEGDKNDRK